MSGTASVGTRNGKFARSGITGAPTIRSVLWPTRTPTLHQESMALIVVREETHPLG
jgi:hypothetical protein